MKGKIKKNILLLDTTGDKITIGFFDGKRVHIKAAKSSSTIYQNIKKLLTDCRLPITAIQAIACIAGPGSFTGVRIGCVIANAFGYAYTIPLYAADSLSASAGAGEKEIALRANRDEQYHAQLKDGIAQKITLRPLNAGTIQEVAPKKRLQNLLALIEAGKIKPQKQVIPLYIKKPNITMKKQ